MIKTNKGFIGAIGDDLPSLIPIFLGLVVFFAVFLGTFNDYNAKNKTYTLNQEAIEISMQLKSDPVIVDYDHFREKCDKIKTTKNWNAFLVDLPLDTEYYENISLQEISDNHESIVLSSLKNNPTTPDYYICNDEEENLEQLKDLSKNHINYLYPIVLQRDNGFSTTARLYVLIWE